AATSTRRGCPADREPPRPGDMEGQRPREAENAGRCPPLRGGTIVDLAPTVLGADGRADPRPRAGARLHECREVTRILQNRNFIEPPGFHRRNNVPAMRRLRALAVLIGSLASAAVASAQVTPAAGYTPPDDTPAIRVGMTLFTNYSWQTDPKGTDANGQSITRNSFDVARSYINITGQISHLVAFRITPDITRQSGIVNSAQVTSDSLVFRIKYAYGQFNLDDWMTRGSWVRLGIQQTPWVDFDEGIYRYRFQGTTFVERLPLLTTFTSADAGVSFHYNLPSNYGDVHVGVYNGENYQRVEVNDQKGFEFRGTLRPLAQGPPICAESAAIWSITTTTTSRVTNVNG